MSKETRLPIGLIIGLSLVMLVVCGGVGLGAFYMGRQSVALPVNTPVLVEPSIAVEPTRTTPPPDPTAPPVGESATQPGTTDTPTVAAPTPTPPPPPFDLDEVQLELFYEVWRIIQNDFDGDLPGSEELLHAAIAGSMETLDDEFTRYIPPNVAQRMRQDLQGSFEGIGAFVRMTDDGFLQIVRPMAGQPAAKAGLQALDLILAVDGLSVVGKTVDEAINLVRGPRGTAVTLTISREDVEEPFDVVVVRDRIEIPIIEAEMLPDEIAYVRLSQFNRNAELQLRGAIEELLAQNPRALIFDLRDNPGGFLDQAVAVADLFLPEGVVLLERNRRGLDEIFRSTAGAIAEDIPLVVLVNAGSASASEIVAGAIQDRGRAILIGETTFGKGSVQQTHRLSDDSELRVTIARWYTPNDKSIDKEGIAPDIEVTPSPLDFRGPDDTQLQRAIEYILTGE
jgi:carboxyl-terminal processing protease